MLILLHQILSGQHLLHLLIAEFLIDIEAGEDIVLSEYPTDGPKLRDSYPQAALMAFAVKRPCHETIYYPEERYRVRHLSPDSFVRNGRDLSGKLALWRYQDDWKFKDMLETETLYFSALDHLTDPFEGAPTESLRQLVETAESLEGSSLFLKFQQRILKQFQGKRSMIDWYKAFYKECCVSCWHIGQEESRQYWDTCETKRAVAVRTRVDNILEATKACPNVSTWKVHYLDYEANREKADRILDYRLEYLASHKDKKYSYENEFRLVYFDDGAFRQRMYSKNGLDLVGGMGFRLPVDLSKLVAEIRLHPEADPSFAEEMELLVRGKLPQVKVERSTFTP